MKRNSNLAVLTILILLTTACIHKAGAPVTPMEKATTYNAALADANNTIEKGAEIAASTGVLTPLQAAPMIGACGRIATIHTQITAVLRQGTPTSASVASIAALIDQVKAAVQAIPPEALGIKNPQSQQIFKTDVANVYSLADAILNALQAGGVK